MTLIRGLAGILVLGAGLASPAAAIDRKACLSSSERAAAIAAHRAAPLSKALRAAKVRIRGELVAARLCQQAQGFVYVLTVLGRDGKVSFVTIDAAVGPVVGGR